MKAYIIIRENILRYFDRRSILVILGFGSYWAWTSSAVFSESLYRHSIISTDLVQFAQFFALCGSAMAALLVLLFSEYLMTLLKKQLFISTLAIMSTLSICLSIISGYTGNVAFLFSGTILTGIMMGLMIFPYALLCAGDHLKRGIAWVSASISVGISFQFIIKAIDPAATLVLTALLPLLGAGLFALWITAEKSQQASSPQTKLQTKMLAKRNADVRKTDTHQEHSESGKALSPLYELFGLSWRLLLGLFIFSFVFALSSGLIYVNAATVEFVGQFQLLAQLIVALSICFGIVIFQWRQDILFKAGFLCLIAGLLILPFVPTNLTFIPAIILMSGNTIFELLVWAILFEVINNNCTATGFIAAKTVAIARLASGFGIFLGALSGILYKSSTLIDSTLTATITAAAAYLVITVTVLILTENHIRGFWALIRVSVVKNPNIEELCAIVAKHYELSSRQQEVLVLLAQGRSVPYIAKQFVVSENTVNTHVKRIYEKLEIHSKQELLNLIDDEKWKSQSIIDTDGVLE
ncbi:MAG: LuxR C-terminal-related transcriptional regulator [Coriobacteriales bacterium]|jgi:DNA-binding CsgD family transcriptional regulator|nr:LuxR C-terminal-related transcriptional regulator [Coriobacteriales bacterium]